ncbi:MAG: phospho-N-acetylmuramoyl-pentapeptide-transferase [Candidatus Omnitrophica bacterium]|nr:phospho-N-acetylmuramoyl-pentapeptide-transferase [Candidatus Omnitrophota bacterium]MDD5774999.1 phospho-N-acetylmuramoyl-pentapeptide-transferase [Candidatus Omnitrophota bacterium]HNQ51030.1 phospho-N-acetylmuramoyl-pentapeptide-transferase [Candidatus Omnitrophota bacterium]HQO38684.1 phospho-N-acetylmuramoyl-pentapeptide-transferase [Candidatus Omnitrophota bacterium]HQQ06179.1 phospho-N-acetylmuramoyl-pentapeptide-transferase [Candidatus Omnitrophota bacterium]
MWYYLLYPFRDLLNFLNILRYITFRASMAALTAFVLVLVFGPAIIRTLKHLHIGQNVRERRVSEKLNDLHKSKQGTPTMGGIFILIAIILSTLFWAELTNKFILLALSGTVWLGITGFMDDYLKVVKKCSKGLTASAKFTSQIVLGLIIGIILYLDPSNSTNLDLPFLKEVSIELGIFYIIFVIVVITGSSNAVNLTDGLDGLAIGTTVFASIAFAVLCYVSGNIKISEYLLIPFINGSGELTVFCASIIGAGLGFLWFNCYPAAVFMGDVGALALGGALGIVAVLIKKELLLVLVGGVFVIEALSVILQVASFRFTGKRLFKCSPLHHHFQFIGWSENQIIVRFWIIASLLALLTLVTLKIR